MQNNELTFVPPAMTHEAQAIAYQQAFADRGLRTHGMSPLADFGGYAGWFVFQAAPAGALLPNGAPKVEDASFFACLVGEPRIVGVVNIRFALNDYLRRIGGHIGYSVHPDFWNRGIATQMLAFALKQTDARDIGEVLLTCNEDNHASARVIVKNGGELHDVHEVNGERIMRFWIKRDGV